jgi:glutamate-1-semialdehyde 2,1-aminomutase
MFVPTISHTGEDVNKTIEALDKTFGVYKKALASTQGYKEFLVGNPVKPVFRQYN